MTKVLCLAALLVACVKPAYKVAVPVYEDPVDFPGRDRDPLLEAAGRGFVAQMQDPSFEIAWMYFLGDGWAALEDEFGVEIGRQVAVTVYSRHPETGCIHWSTNLAQAWLQDRSWGEPYFDGGNVQTVTCESLDAVMARHPNIGIRPGVPGTAAGPGRTEAVARPAGLAAKAETALPATPFRIERKGKTIVELRADRRVLVNGKPWARLGDDNILYDDHDLPLLAIDRDGAIWQDLRGKGPKQTGGIVDGTLTWNLLADAKVSSAKGRFTLVEKGTARSSNERIVPDAAAAGVTPFAIVFLRLDVLTWKR